jgi:hypothetical protein
MSRGGYALALAGLFAVGTLAANPARRENHERWHRLHPAPVAPELARWFLPGELGYEPGAEPPPAGPRAFLTRCLYGVDNLDGGEWARRNGLGPGLRFSHNLAGIFRPELFDAHPEFFALINGERARPRPTRVNWNPELGTAESAAFAAQAANAYFDANPEALSFSVGINDALRYGDSEATRRRVYPPRYFRNMPVYSDLVFNFTNAVAAEVAVKHPDKLIGALAYYWTEQVPGFPLHPQVVPYLTADRSQLYDRAFRREESALQHAWAQKGTHRLGLYDYIYGYGFLVPRIHTTTLARHLRDARRTGFTDYFAELVANWGLDGPQPWLVAQLLQDPEQSPRVLLAEYYRRFFRGAAAPMRAFYEKCEALWAGQGGPVYWLKHYRNDSQAALFPPGARRRLRAHLDAAARAAASDSQVAARVALVSAAFSVSERYVEFNEAREALGRAVLAAGGGDATARARLGPLREADRAARSAFLETVPAVRVAQPYAMAPTIPVDFARADWGPSADWLLAGGKLEAGRELLADAGWRGVKKPDLRLAGLLYEPGLTQPWVARTEPWEGLVAELRGDGTEPRTLHLENNKTSAFEQGLVCPPTGSGTASWEISGRISPTSQVLFRVLWYDAYQAPCGETTVQIPAGEWKGVAPVIPLVPPANAFFLGFSLNLLHQQRGDWLQVRNVALTWRD